MHSALSSLLWGAFAVTTSFVLGVVVAKIGGMPWRLVLNNTALIGIAYILAEAARSAGAPFWVVFPPYVAFCFFGVWRVSFWLSTGKWPTGKWPMGPTE